MKKSRHSTCRHSVLSIQNRFFIFCIMLLNIFSLSVQAEVEQARAFHHLGNQALLKHLKQLYNQVEPTLRQEQRALLTNLEMIKRLQQEKRRLTLKEQQHLSAEASIKKKLNRLHKTEQNQTQQLKLIDKENHLWKVRKKQLESLQNTLLSWNQTRVQLDLGRLEFLWRIRDNTFKRKNVPYPLQQNQIDGRHNRYRGLYRMLQKQLDTTEENIQRLLNDQEKLKQAQSTLTKQKQTLFRQQQKIIKRKQFSEDIQKKRLKVRQNLLAQIQAEYTWRMGTFLLGTKQLDQLLAKSEKLEKARAANRPLLIDHSEKESIAFDISRAERYAQQLKTRQLNQSQRVKQTKAYHATLSMIIKKGEHLMQQSRVLDDRILELQVLLKSLPKTSKDQKSATTALSTRLHQGIKQLNKQTTKLTTALQRSQVRLPKEAEKLKEAEKRFILYLGELEHFEKNLTQAQQKHQQVKQLKKLANQQIIQKIEQSEINYLTVSKKFQESQHHLTRMQQQTTQRIERINASKDVLFSSTQNSLWTEKNRLRKHLYNLANFPASALIAKTETKPPAVRSPLAKLEQWGDQNDRVPVAGLYEELTQYQNLLTSRIQFLEDQKQQKAAILDALSKERDAVKQTIQQLEQTLMAAQQSYAGVIELQKRLGQGELTADQLPSVLYKLLNADRIAPLEKQHLQLIAQRQRIKREEERFTQMNQEIIKALPTLIQLRTLIDSKLSLHGDWQRLYVKEIKTEKDLSDLEQKNLVQEARRRLDASEGRLESMLTLFASKRGSALTEILLAFHKEVILFEKREHITKKQIDLATRLIKLNNRERNLLQTLVKDFETAYIQLSQSVEIEEQQIKQRLSQSNTAEGDTSTDQQINRSILSNDQEKKKRIIDQWIEQLFEQRIQKAVQFKWLTLLSTRASRFGLSAEQRIYQEKVQALTSETQRLARNIDQLKGFSEQRLKEIILAEGELSPQKLSRLKQGEIRITQLDRLENQKKTAVWAIIKFTAILLIAFSIRHGVEVFIWQRLEKKAEHAIPNLVRGLVSAIIFLIAGFAIVSFVFGQTLTGLLATSGMMAMIIGLAVQMNISNIFSGLAINIERPFVVGDDIKVSGITGSVVDITWRTTRILTMTQELVTVPNSQAAESTIVNYTKPNEYYWKGFSVYLTQEHQPEEIEKLLYECLDKVDHIKTPWVMFLGFNDWAADYQVWFHIPYSKRWAVPNQIWITIWKAFKERGITPKFKQFHNIPPESH
ncbi:mechanosensitive ion channel domain-containing protein [Magnetococcales bacterium HHB-1]